MLYIISDFYADSSLLNQVLIHFGIRKYFKDIFVSSEYNARKSTGKLYEVFLSRLNVAPESVTMIGDNYKSDVINPMNLGLASYFKEYKHVTGSIVDKKELKTCIEKRCTLMQKLLRLTDSLQIYCILFRSCMSS